VYTSFAQSTKGSNQDSIVQFDLASGTVQGDRIRLNTLPGSLTNAGAITATTLDAAIASLYVDKNRSLTGNQAIASGDAVIFSHRATGALAASTYLMVASSNSATNSSSDLFMKIGSFVGTGLTTGVLTTSNFFTT